MGRAQRLGRGVRIVDRDLPERPLPGERGSQFVRGVGDESALCLEGVVQPGEQGVERVAEFLELVVGSGEGEALVQVGGRDVADGGGDRAQRAQNPSGHRPTQGDRDDRHAGQGDARLQ